MCFQCWRCPVQATDPHAVHLPFLYSSRSAPCIRLCSLSLLKATALSNSDLLAQPLPANLCPLDLPFGRLPSECLVLSNMGGAKILPHKMLWLWVLVELCFLSCMQLSQMALSYFHLLPSTKQHTWQVPLWVSEYTRCFHILVYYIIPLEGWTLLLPLLYKWIQKEKQWYVQDHTASEEFEPHIRSFHFMQQSVLLPVFSKAKWLWTSSF